MLSEHKDSKVQFRLVFATRSRSWTVAARGYPDTTFGEVKNGAQDWEGNSEAGDTLAAQKPPCLCAYISLILGDRDSPIYAAQNHMFVGNRGRWPLCRTITHISDYGVNQT